MAVIYKTYQSKRGDKTLNKWYARVVPMGKLTLDDLAERIQQNVSVKSSDVFGVVKELYEQIKIALQEGMKVKLGDLGYFKSSIESTGTEKAKDWSQQSNLRKVRVTFTPVRTKDASSKKYTKALVKGATLEPLQYI